MELINNQLEKLRHRYVKESDNGYSFTLVKNINIYYFYININEKSIFQYFKKKDSDQLSSKFNEIVNDVKKNISLYNNTEFPILFEGIIDPKGTKFFLYDILIYKDIECNSNYKTRYLLLKEIYSKYFGNCNNIKILKSYTNNQTLSDIFHDVIPQLPYKINYIIMTYNFKRQIIDYEQIDTKINENKKIKNNYIMDLGHIKNIEKIIDIKKIYIFNIFKTNKSEIYVIKSKQIDFLLNLSINDYLIVRVPNIRISKQIKKKLPKNIECKYNKIFKKFEIFIK